MFLCRASVRPSVMLSPQCLWYASIDFHQTFVVSASCRPSNKVKNIQVINSADMVYIHINAVYNTEIRLGLI